jgi:ferredoxin
MKRSFADGEAIDTLRSTYDAVLLATGGGDEASDLGVTQTRRGVTIDGRTYQTSKADVFAAGGAVRKTRLAVRSVAGGKLAAKCIDRYLRGEHPAPAEPAAAAAMGRLDEQELVTFMLDAPPHQRITPEGGLHRGFTADEAVREASRCMQCNCDSGADCRIRRIATRLGADLSRYRGERRNYQRVQRAGGVVFEPGKCISCGLCVAAVRAKAPLGLTLVGRGFDVRLAVPFDGSLAEGLGDAASDAVRLCPTGALRFESGVVRTTPLTVSTGG